MKIPRTVEFAGIPGSGKTSLSNRTAAILRAQGVDVFTYLEASRLRAWQSVAGSRPAPSADHRITWTASWWLFYLMSALRAVPFVWKRRSEIARLARHQMSRRIRPRMKAHIAWWFLQLGGRRSYLDSATSIDAILYDDGFVHRSVALFSAPGEPNGSPNVGDYLTSMPHPDAVVLVRAGVDICLQRVIDRGVWRHSENATKEDLQVYLETAERILQTAIDVMRQTGVPVLEVNNHEGSLEETAESLATRLESLVVSGSK